MLTRFAPGLQEARCGLCTACGLKGGAMRFRANILTIPIARLMMRRAVKIAGRRPPDFVIGAREDPYLLRWWIVPRNRFFNVYVHNVLRDDDDRALHDHPWWSASLMLSGHLKEVLKGDDWRVLSQGDIVLRSARFAHRLAIWNHRGTGVWTLFITGPRVREWGFLCPKGWRHWRVFTATDGTGASIVGRGCD